VTMLHAKNRQLTGNYCVRDFTGPGQARLVTADESKVEDAIRHAVTRTEKQTAQGPGADPEDLGTAWQEPVREM
jgi:hypothetical protein